MKVICQNSSQVPRDKLCIKRTHLGNVYASNCVSNNTENYSLELEIQPHALVETFVPDPSVFPINTLSTGFPY